MCVNLIYQNGGGVWGTGTWDHHNVQFNPFISLIIIFSNIFNRHNSFSKIPSLTLELNR